MTNITDEIFTAYEGKEKKFTLNGKELVIPARLDTFIFYRTKFRELAKVCSDKAVEEYIDSVHDLDSYIDLFPQIYDRNLRIAIGKAIDILISEGIYNISVELFEERQKRSFHYGSEDYQATVNSIKLTEQNNSNVSQGMMNSIGSLFGKKSGLGQSFINGFTEGAVKEGSKITDEQKRELYKRIKPYNLFSRVYFDYWNTFITLISILNENGKDIWLLDDGAMKEIDNVIKSMSNPNFPKDKILDILFDAILKKPIESSIYKVIEEKFGKTEEVAVIFDYFIYPEFSKIPYSEDDFPKQEEQQISKEAANQDNTQSTGETENQNEKKGLFSFADKLDGEKMKKGLKIGAGILALGMLAGKSQQGDSEARGSNGSGRQNMFGNVHCDIARGKSAICTFGCPLWRHCTHRGEYKVGSR